MIKVGHPGICDYPDISSVSSVAAADDQTVPWLLELRQALDGSAICQVHPTDDLRTGAVTGGAWGTMAIRFKTYELTLSVPQASSRARAVVRDTAGQPASEDEWVFQPHRSAAGSMLRGNAAGSSENTYSITSRMRVKRGVEFLLVSA